MYPAFIRERTSFSLTFQIVGGHHCRRCSDVLLISARKQGKILFHSTYCDLGVVFSNNRDKSLSLQSKIAVSNIFSAKLPN